MTDSELQEIYRRMVACVRTTAITIKRRIETEGWPEEAIVNYMAELERQLWPIMRKYQGGPANPQVKVGRPPIDRSRFRDMITGIPLIANAPPFESSPFAELYKRAQAVGNSDITIGQCKDMYYKEYFVFLEDDPAAFWTAYVKGIRAGYLTPFLPSLVPEEVKAELMK